MKPSPARSILHATLVLLLAGPGRAGEVERILAEALEADAAGREAARKELVELGPSAVPEVLGLYRSRPDDPDEPPPPVLEGGGRELLFAAVAEWPEGEWVAALVDEIGDEPTLEDRFLALQIFADAGGRSGASAVLDLLEGMPAIQMRRAYVRRLGTQALAGIVERDAHAHAPLLARARRLPTAVQVVLARALGRVGDRRGVPVLVDLLNGEAEAVVAALAALAELDPRDYDAAVHDAGSACIDRLNVHAPEVRRQALDTLRRLAVADAFELAIDLLDDPDAGVRRTARGLLEDMSGRRYGEDAARWTNFLRSESTWLEERGSSLARLVSVGSPAEAVGALRELSEHPLHRRTLVPFVARGLDHDDTTVARLAAEALVRLGDPTGIGPLVDAWERGHDRRPVFGDALERLSGARSDDWADWLAH